MAKKNEIMMLETGDAVFAGPGTTLSTTVQNMFGQAGITASGTVNRVSDTEATVALADGRAYLVKKSTKEIKIYQTAEATPIPGVPTAATTEKKERRSSKSILRSANAREQEYIDEVAAKLEAKKLTRKEMSKAKKRSLEVYRDVQENLLENAVMTAIATTLPKHFFRSFKIDENIIEAEIISSAPRLIECKVSGKKK